MADTTDIFDINGPNPIVDFSRAVRAFGLASRDFNGAAEDFGVAMRSRYATDHLNREATHMPGTVSNTEGGDETEIKEEEGGGHDERVGDASANFNSERDDEEYQSRLDRITRDAAAFRARFGIRHAFGDTDLVLSEYVLEPTARDLSDYTLESSLDHHLFPTHDALNLEDLQIFLSEPGSELPIDQIRELWEQYMSDIEDDITAPTLPSRETFLATGVLSLNSSSTRPTENCTICMEPIDVSTSEARDEAVVIEACGHIYHRECVMQWFNNLHPEARFGTDPLCRRRLFVNPGYDEYWDSQDEEDYSDEEEYQEDEDDDEIEDDDKNVLEGEDADEMYNDFINALGDPSHLALQQWRRDRMRTLQDRRLYYLERNNHDALATLREELRTIEQSDPSPADRRENRSRTAALTLEIALRENELKEERDGEEEIEDLMEDLAEAEGRT